MFENLRKASKNVLFAYWDYFQPMGAMAEAVNYRAGQSLQLLRQSFLDYDASQAAQVGDKCLSCSCFT